ncbi:MAG: energy-coupling factor transporter transmembrane protein EcfT [Anaerolineales bacterium]|nr:energy-coupling factor transporter transmembrane protein EcfT [Anaerolineales bacterium]
MRRFRYMHGTSFFHRMDPTWKLIWNVVVLLSLLFNFQVPYAVAWFVYTACLALFLADITPRQYLRSISYFLGIALFILVWRVLYSPFEGTVLWSWGPIDVTREGITEGVAIFFRFLVLATVTTIFTLTTDPGRMVESLVQIARVPYRIGFAMYAALRFIPLFENEAQVINNAHLIRGVGETGRDPLSRLRLTSSLVVPLLVSGIRRARSAAIAMDSRCFGAYDRRTVLHPQQATPAALWFVLAHLAVGLASFIYFFVLGHGVVYH